MFKRLRALFGSTSKQDLKRTGECIRREYPILQAKPEYRDSTPEVLLDIARQLCVGKRIAGTI
jgi:hypothetical protein